MAALVCEICGGKLQGKAGGIFVCESCGMEYDKSWVQEKAQEIKGTVKVEGTVDVTGSTIKVDNAVRLSNLYKLAEIDIAKSNCGNALQYYESIIVEEPTSWQAHFYIPYIKTVKAKRRDAFKELNAFCDNYTSVFEMIKLISNENEQLSALKTVFERSKKMYSLFENLIMNEFQKELEWTPFIPSNVGVTEAVQIKIEKSNHDKEANNTKIKNLAYASNIFMVMGDEIDTAFPNNQSLHSFAVISWKEYINHLPDVTGMDDKVINEWNARVNNYTNKIRTFEPNYSFAPPQVEKPTNKNSKPKMGLGYLMIFGSFALGMLLMYLYSETYSDGLMIFAIILMSVGLGSGIVYFFKVSNNLKKEKILKDEQQKNISKKDERIDKIKELAKEDKLQAIKKYMEVYNVGLAEAKEAVDKLIEE